MNNICQHIWLCAVLLLAAAAPGADDATTPDSEPQLIPVQKFGPADLRIVQYIDADQRLRRHYPQALTSLLREVDKQTTAKVDPEPIIIDSFDDPLIFEHPFLFVNFAERANWTLTANEAEALRNYLTRGGFMFIDAGINAEFLRGKVAHGQHHSFADWEASPLLQEAFKAVFPDQEFSPLPRTHAIFTSFYKGLPDPSILPDTVREFVINEKWPDGTYSAVALHVGERLAVLATPIISMGWGRDYLGNWRTTIRFRIRESATGLSDYLQTAAYSGERYEATREDSRKDIIYCQKEALPAWVNEPDSRWRVFRYYHSREISEYAHLFYSQLGVNFITYALTH